MPYRIGEINIICTDLERSLLFYRDVLGFEALQPEGPSWHLACGNVKFLLLGVAELARKQLPYCTSPEFSLDLLVPDLREARRRFESANVTFIAEFPPSNDRFFIRDPDGLVIEIIQSKDGSA